MAFHTNPSSYCLYCFASPLSEDSRCPACGSRSLPSLRQVYWNRVPRYIRLEFLWKTVALLSFFIIFSLMRHGPVRPVGPGSGGGWLVVLPMCLSYGLWKTAEKWTQRNPYFRPSWLWGLSFACFGVVAATRSLYLSLLLILVAIGAAQAGQFGEKWKRRVVSKPIDPTQILKRAERTCVSRVTLAAHHLRQPGVRAMLTRKQRVLVKGSRGAGLRVQLEPLMSTWERRQLIMVWAIAVVVYTMGQAGDRALSFDATDQWIAGGALAATTLIGARARRRIRFVREYLAGQAASGREQDAA